MSQVNALNINTQHSGNAMAQPATESNAAKQNQPATAKNDTDTVKINDAVVRLNNALTTMRKDERQFQVDEDLGKLVVKIINSDTKELVRQIPSEEALALSKRMQEMLKVMYG